MKTEYSKKLKRLRKLAGISLATLSEVSGIPITTLHGYETKIAPRVDVYDDLVAICKGRIKQNAEEARRI